MPSDDFLTAYDDAPAAVEARPAPGRNIRSSRVKRGGEVDGFGAFFTGVTDTATFGFLDEAGGFVDTLGLTHGRQNIWNSKKGFGQLLDENIDENREVLRGIEEDHGTAYTAGQIAGGFLPVFGIGGASVKGMTLSGAAFGAAYGLGAGEDGLGNRLTSAAAYGASGALGGYVFGAMILPAAKAAGGLLFKRGSPVRVAEADLPVRPTVADDLAPAVARKEPGVSPAGTNASVKLGPAASVSDELPEGALLSARELLGDPGAARASLVKRIGKMSVQEAQRLFQRIDAAEASGEVVTDPHYRSLLGIDLSDTTLTTDEVVQVAELFEEATEKLAEKAGMEAKTVKGMESLVGKELKKGVTLDDLEEAFEQGKQGFVKTRIAQHVMLTATAKVIRLRTEVLPLVLRGDAEARVKLADELTDAAHRFVLAKGILSNAGRQLGVLAHGTKAKMVDVADDIFELESPEMIRKRVDSAIRELGDKELGELLGQVKTLADGDRIAKVLLDPAEAKAFSTWTRAINTVSLFLRSNALTPATGLFNTIGFVANDFFRNDLAKTWAARGLVKAGRVDEGLALKLEAQVGRAVYWKAHKEGLKALLKRVQWEFWSDVERISGVGWGPGTVNAKARLKQTSMLSDGFMPPEMREFKERFRLNVEDTAGFNANLEATRGDGAFGNLVYHLHRARAVAANTLDAGGSAAMKLFTGGIDDWGREFVRVKETHAQAARFAIREAIGAGVPPEKLGEYASRRAKELAELPPAEIMDRVEAALIASDDLTGEAKFLAEVHKIVKDEADTVLFMDGPQSTIGKASGNLLSSLDRLGIVFPFVRTPIRLFEQGVVNYGPLAKLSGEVQDVLRRAAAPNATPDEKLAGALENARVEIGTMVFQAGLTLGLAGGITATNGGFNNSANLDAGPANRLNFPGGGFLEFGRFDPFSFTVGMGAMIGQAFREGFADGTDYDQEEALKTGIATAYMAARDSILDKAYLKGLADILEVTQADSVSGAGDAVGRLLGNAGGRLVPLGGVTRQVHETFRSSAVEAAGFMDQLLRHIPGAGFGMAPRVDALGDEVKGRTLGINFGNSELTEGEPISDVKRQLRELGINISTIRKADPDGFDLTSEELSEVRKIRAKEATNSQGLTMHEALADLFADPWFQSLPTKDQKRDQIVETMQEFNKPAWEILAERNPGFAAKKSYTKSLADYIAEGMSRREAEGSALSDVEADGLPQPNL